MTLNNLGLVLRDLRRLEEAEGAFREALEIYRRLAEESHRCISLMWQ
jgi:tetratricopeptide (TPR) repeat protein